MVYNMTVDASSYKLGFTNESGGLGSGVGGDTFSLELELAMDMSKLQAMGQSAAPCPPGDTGTIAKSYAQGLFKANKNDPEALDTISNYMQTFQFSAPNSLNAQIAQEWTKLAGPGSANASAGLPAGYFA